MPETIREATQWPIDLWAHAAKEFAENPQPVSEESRCRRKDFFALLEMARHGELSEFRGEYVLLLDGKVVGHGADLAAVRTKAVQEHNVSGGRFAVRFVH